MSRSRTTVGFKRKTPSAVTEHDNTRGVKDMESVKRSTDPIHDFSFLVPWACTYLLAEGLVLSDLLCDSMYSVLCRRRWGFETPGQAGCTASAGGEGGAWAQTRERGISLQSHDHHSVEAQGLPASHGGIEMRKALALRIDSVESSSIAIDGLGAN